MKRTTKVSPRTVNLETKVLRMILRRARLWARIADDFKSLREDKRGPGRHSPSSKSVSCLKWRLQSLGGQSPFMRPCLLQTPQPVVAN